MHACTLLTKCSHMLAHGSLTCFQQVISMLAHGSSRLHKMPASRRCMLARRLKHKHVAMGSTYPSLRLPNHVELVPSAWEPMRCTLPAVSCAALAQRRTGQIKRKTPVSWRSTIHETCPFPLPEEKSQAQSNFSTPITPVPVPYSSASGTSQPNLVLRG